MAKKTETSRPAKPAAGVTHEPPPAVSPATGAGPAAPAPVQEKPAAQAVAAAAVKPKDKKDDLRDGVFVKSKPVSIRRCGFRFDRDGCGIALNLLSDEQLERLENDPDLIVERCQFPMNEDA